jgi:Rrf2 family protein
MVDLARHHGQGPLPLAEIAAHEGLPLPFLEQIVADLREGGLVRARRGRGGGYTLARPPAEIRMGEVVRLLEGGIAPMICVPDEPYAPAQVNCERQDCCSTRVLWLRVRDSIVEALDATTLADLVPGAAVPMPLMSRAELRSSGSGSASMTCADLVVTSGGKNTLREATRSG